MFDSRCSSSLLLLSLIEMILVGYIYGVNKFLTNIEEMKMNLGPVLTVYWKVMTVVLVLKFEVLTCCTQVMWLAVSPVIMAAVIILRWINSKPMT